MGRSRNNMAKISIPRLPSLTHTQRHRQIRVGRRRRDSTSSLQPNTACNDASSNLRLETRKFASPARSLTRGQPGMPSQSYQHGLSQANKTSLLANKDRHLIRLFGHKESKHQQPTSQAENFS